MPTDSALKIVSDSGDTMMIAGYGVRFGGVDLTGDSFSPTCDFWLGGRLSPTPPVLFQHGQDPMMRKTVVGRVVSTHVDDIGLWVEAQLQASKAYIDAIRKLIKAGALGWSSGSAPQFVERVKGIRPGVSEIVKWGIIEASLTSTPAEPRCLGIRELKSLTKLTPQLTKLLKATGGTSLQEASYEDLQGDLQDAACEALNVPYVVVSATYPDHVIVMVSDGMDTDTDDEDSTYWDFPYTLGDDGEPVLGDPKPVQAGWLPGAAKAPMSADTRNNLPNRQFAYVDSDGGTHLPINDAAHVRAAMARFNQTSFESPDKKKAAARKILARARALGIDVSPDSAVATAAKDGGKSMTDLPDGAFAFIEDGGMLDDEQKTFPRANRKFAHHDHSGEVDLDSLAVALNDATKSGASTTVIAHLKRHAINAGLPFWPAHDQDDAHSPQWSEGTAPALLLMAAKMVDLAEMIAADRLSMERLGLDTKSGGRLTLPVRTQLKDLHSSIGQALEWADRIERGEDGKSRVDMFRHKLAMLELSEVS